MMAGSGAWSVIRTIRGNGRLAPQPNAIRMNAKLESILNPAEQAAPQEEPNALKVMMVWVSWIPGST